MKKSDTNQNGPDQTRASIAESRSKTVFLGRIGHELRTPLNSILGFTQLLQKDQPTSLSENQQKKIDNIEKAGWHLLQLVNDLLDLTSIENETVEIHLASISVADSVIACVDLIEPLAGQRNISVATANAIIGDELFVWADPTRLKQVLLNLLNNAIKYNREGGQVHVAIEPQKEDTVRITVSDTGSGIPARDQLAIFEPFTRSNTSKHPGGTGIGLTLVMELVTLMGGTVGLTSQPGEGSSFWIELRRAKEQEDTSRRHGTDVSTTEGILADDSLQHLVLYIEDSPLHTELVKDIFLEIQGVGLISASTPRHGLELARTLQPTLILLDLCLPEMDGYTVLGCLRRHAQTRDTPVIALSANVMPEDIEKALSCGFRRFITKPIDVEKFKRAVLELLADESALKRS